LEASSKSQSAKIAIIGRPNVGKSSLFNYLVGRREALVKNQPGVTRDIHRGECLWRGRTIEIWDTGGVSDEGTLLSDHIREQIEQLLPQVDSVIAMFDGRAGLCIEDSIIFRIAKESGLPVLYLVNKIDQNDMTEDLLADFYEFGVDLLAASIEQRLGVDQIMDWIDVTLPDKSQLEQTRNFSLSIVGKPNVGKSSLFNELCGLKRAAVEDQPGTTTDVNVIPIKINEIEIDLIDTAGVRRPSKVEDHLEKLSAMRSEEAIAKSRLVMIVVDALVGPTGQDARLCEHAIEANTAVLLVVNKMDLLYEAGKTKKDIIEEIEKVFHFFEDIPYVFLSVKNRSGIGDLKEMIVSLKEKLERRIPTPELNDFFVRVIRKAPAPVHRSKDVKFYYLTQTNQLPPSFIAFVNYPEGVTPSYRRFLAKQIKSAFHLESVPVRIFAMKKGGREL